MSMPLSMVSMPVQPFDVAGLRGALPVAVPTATAAPMQRAQMDGAANVAWATDFLARQPATSQTQTRTHTQAHGQGHAQAQVIPATQVEMQQDRVQQLMSPRGGMHSASLVLVRSERASLTCSSFCFPSLLSVLFFSFGLVTRSRRCTSVEPGVWRVWDGYDCRCDGFDGRPCATAHRTE